MKRCIVLVVFFIMTCGTGAYSGNFTSKTIDYKDNDTALEGFIVYDAEKKGKMPGIIIVHEWNGLGDYVKGRAVQLSQMGYAVFCADIYGKGVRPANKEESGRQAGIYRADRQLMRSRINAALSEFKRTGIADNKKIAAMGYCFGGGVVLELARSGSDIAGVVSFHGSLDTPNPAKEGDIKTKILVLHGADDKNIADGKLQEFINEMRGAKAGWQMVLYGNAVHAFTNSANDQDPSDNVAYNKEADLRSWEAMSDFFGELFEK